MVGWVKNIFGNIKWYMSKRNFWRERREEEKGNIEFRIMVPEHSDSLLKTGSRLRSEQQATVNAVAYTEEIKQNFAEKLRDVAGSLQVP